MSYPEIAKIQKRIAKTFINFAEKKFQEEYYEKRNKLLVDGLGNIDDCLVIAKLLYE